MYAGFLSARGEHDAAIQHILRARQLEPDSIAVNIDAAWLFFYARRYDEAVTESRRGLDRPAAVEAMEAWWLKRPPQRRLDACLLSSAH